MTRLFNIARAICAAFVSAFVLCGLTVEAQQPISVDVWEGASSPILLPAMAPVPPTEKATLPIIPVPTVPAAPIPPVQPMRPPRIVVELTPPAPSGGPDPAPSSASGVVPVSPATQMTGNTLPIADSAPATPDSSVPSPNLQHLQPAAPRAPAPVPRILSPPPLASPAPLLPSINAPTIPPSPPAVGGIAPSPMLPTEAEMRLRALEQQNLQLSNQLEAVRQQLADEARQIFPSDYYYVPGQLGRPLPRQVLEEEEERDTARVSLDHGLHFTSASGRYRIELHDLTQMDMRIFSPSGAGSATDPALHNTFDIPRQRLYFAGQVDKNFDFYSVINRGYGTLDVLDSYMNVKFSPQFNVRFGRTKTPYTYEYYKTTDADSIAAERSVFVGNLSPNRQLGIMAFGRLFQERFEYALGLFNGPHRSFQDFNNYKNPFIYVNARPFLFGNSDLLRNWNLGGSFNFGRENDPLEPNGLRTANDETTTAAVDNVSPTFLRFNPKAIENGGTAFWAVDSAWYYRSFTSLLMYNGGYMTYATPTQSGIRVPFEGGSVAATYFLTGEEIVTRKGVEPLRNFDWRSPLQHPGAIEYISRVAYLNAGSQIYSGGLADPKLWSKDALVFDNGFNWYLNSYVMFRFDWQLARYGRPIQIDTDRFTKTTNMFWFRTQIYY